VGERFLPAGSTSERDVVDVEAYVRATIRRALPQVDSQDEIDNMVNQGLLIAEEITQRTPLGASFRQALAAALANELHDYWREQHPEVRRNTRAQRRAAQLGEPYTMKVFQATGLADDITAWEREPLAPQGDVVQKLEQEVYDRLKLDELSGITCASELMADPHKAGLLFGVASARKLLPDRAERVYETIEELRERSVEAELPTFIY
jgi:hypothetical protein